MKMTMHYALALGILSVALPAAVQADDDKLRDLGTNAVPGEIAKWDGADWRLAHDNVGVDTVVAGPGISATSSNGTTTVSADFSGSGSSNTVARSDHSHADLNATRPPIGAIVAWAKSLTGVPALPSGWVECSGQTLADTDSPLDDQVIPDLNGDNDENKRFLRGADTSGGSGGSSSHSHGSTGFDGQGGIQAGAPSGASHIPPYYEVVWIMQDTYVVQHTN